MQHITIQLDAKTFSIVRLNILNWANDFDTAMVLDSNQCEGAYQLDVWEMICGAGIEKIIAQNSLDNWKFSEKEAQDFLLAWFNYDLKNEIESLTSEHYNGIEFPTLMLFKPQHLIRINKTLLMEIISPDADSIASFIQKQHSTIPKQLHTNISIQQGTSKEEYIENVNRIQHEIIEGNVYELNYCVEFYAEVAEINPLEIYLKLTQYSPVPYAAFLKHLDKYLLCASPERFICKQNKNIYSQPIKGTRKRGKNAFEDEDQIQRLKNSEKERAENLMIVDLVRNDLARSCETGTIETPELFQIYSFPQVHQMISTVKGKLRSTIRNKEIFCHAFPMGSMTGAPKISAMQLIEKYESVKRGLYSGSVGYINGENQFDLNVVIRSIQYNQSKKYLSFMVGSAITIDSIAEEEYDECLLKAKAIFKALN